MADAALAVADTDAVEAALNYIVDDGTPPALYVDWPEEAHKAHPPTYAVHPTPIHNGRPLRDSFNLPEHGFAFTDHLSALTEFYDSAAVERIYYPEAAALIAAHIDAPRVHVFDHTIRAGDATIVAEKGVRQPVKAVHNDYTERSAPQRVRDLLPAAEATAALERRFAIVQIWRPIGAPVESEPLAICDGSTIPETGFIRMERRYRHRTAEVYHISWNAAHRWYWFPAMTPAEAIVFKVFDTDRSAGVRFTAHTGFDLPDTPADARSRESIEIRALALF